MVNDTELLHFQVLDMALYNALASVSCHCHDSARSSRAAFLSQSVRIGECNAVNIFFGHFHVREHEFLKDRYQILIWLLWNVVEGDVVM